MYGSGQGVEQDFKEAVKWYQKAAEQENADGQNNLGWMYQNGLGVPEDYKEAVKWYRKAADQGNTDAQVNLGRMYHGGAGVMEDDVTAHAWYTLAATNGDADAPTIKSDLEKKMTPAQITEAEALAKEMIKKNPKLINK